MYFIGHTPKILVDNPPIETALYKSMSCTHTRFTRCPCARAMLILLHGIYVFHACFSTHTISMLMYPAYTYQHLIHILYVIQTKKINMHLRFFSSFPISEKQHAYTNIILTKLHVTQPRNNHSNWIFSRFPAQKNNMHILTLSSQKLHVTQLRIIMQT